MKKTKILSLVLAFLMMLTSVGVFAEETTETPYQLPQTAIELRDNIASAICNTEDGWTAFAMALYEKHALGESAMSNAAKQSIIDSYITESQSDTATAGDRARIEIVLSSLEKDTTQLYPIAKEKVDNSELLSALNHTAGGHYAAPWILLANLQGNTELTDEQIENLIAVLDANKGTGLFESEWEGVAYTDADTAGASIAALAPLYESNDDARELADYIVTGLEDAIGENGSFGSANSDAMVIIGLIALGENPYEFKSETTEKSVVDGLLSYVNEANNGFTFYGSENYLATEQGLRALIALSAYEGEAYNIYDFSTTEKFPAYQMSSDKITTLRDNIAGAICNTEDTWTAFTMAVYEKYTLGESVMSDETKQKIINDYIAKAKDETTTASDRAKIEIVLRSLGIDTKNLYSVNSNTPTNNGELLKNSDHTQRGHYAAPWILLADMQGNTELTDEQIENLIAVLDANKGTGLFESEWEGVTYTDADTASVTLAALSGIYDTNANAKTLSDTIYEALKDAIDENGSFGNANSDAMVIMGLISIGKNPYEFRNETSKKSIVDGLLSYVNEDNNAFTFYGAENFMATEQGLRALIALSVFDGEKYNIYDFSDKEVQPGREQGAEIPEEEPEDTPPVSDGVSNTIKVRFTLKSDTKVWINNKKLTLPKRSTVYDAFSQIVEMNDNLEVEGLENGYIKSVTYKGTTLAEFDQGPNSGWLYKVNDESPNIGFNSFVLSNNDTIVWYYTEDWKKTYHGGSAGDNSEKEPEKEPEKPTEIKYEDTENHWAKDAITYISQKGIMNGIDENNFAPDEKLTRGMLVTMLYRLSGDDAKGENGFSDISSDAWYKDAAIWASENGITDGYGNGKFGADDEVTREQLAVFLKRYADLKKMEFSTEDTQNFEDAHKISSWAKDAILWAKVSGILSGRENNTFDPLSGATRAEIATVFMRFIENVSK